MVRTALQPRQREAREWYNELDKPGFTFPSAVFPIVWTSLYAMIAWSGWRVWSAPASMNRSLALRFWFSQLSTHAKWSKLFFGQHRPDLALTDLLMLEGLCAGLHRGGTQLGPRCLASVHPFRGVGGLRGTVERGNRPA
jgi:tryptophan-rich sensory protein